MADWPDPMTLGVVCYPKCGLLDVCGPLAAFGAVQNVFEAVLLADAAGPVATAQGVSLCAQAAYGDAPALDLLLVEEGDDVVELRRPDPLLLHGLADGGDGGLADADERVRGRVA